MRRLSQKTSAVQAVRRQKRSHDLQAPQTPPSSKRVRGRLMPIEASTPDGHLDTPPRPPAKGFPVEFGFSPAKPSAAALPDQSQISPQKQGADVCEDALAVRPEVCNRDVPVLFGFAPASLPTTAQPCQPVFSQCTALQAIPLTEVSANTALEQATARSPNADFPVQFGFSPAALPQTTQHLGDAVAPQPVASFAAGSAAESFLQTQPVPAAGGFPVEFGFSQASNLAHTTSSQPGVNALALHSAGLAKPAVQVAFQQPEWTRRLQERLHSSVDKAVVVAEPKAAPIVFSTSRQVAHAVTYPHLDTAFAKDVLPKRAAPQVASRLSEECCQSQSKAAKKGPKKPSMAIESLLEARPPQMAIEAWLPGSAPKMAIEALLPADPFESEDMATFPFFSSGLNGAGMKSVEQRKDVKSCTKRPDGTQIKANSQRSEQELFSVAGNERMHKKVVERSNTRMSKTSGASSVTDSMKTVEVRWM